MLAFEIVLNHDTPIVAGSEECVGLHATVSANSTPNKRRLNYVELHISGLVVPPEHDRYEHLLWKGADLRAGDEIRIRIVETEKVDPPQNRYRSDYEVQEDPYTAEEREEMDRKLYLELREKFGDMA